MVGASRKESLLLRLRLDPTDHDGPWFYDRETLSDMHRGFSAGFLHTARCDELPHIAQVTLTVAMRAGRNGFGLAQIPAFPAIPRIPVRDATGIESGTASEDAWDSFWMATGEQMARDLR